MYNNKIEPSNLSFFAIQGLALHRRRHINIKNCIKHYTEHYTKIKNEKRTITSNSGSGSVVIDNVDDDLDDIESNNKQKIINNINDIDLTSYSKNTTRLFYAIVAHEVMSESAPPHHPIKSKIDFTKKLKNELGGELIVKKGLDITININKKHPLVRQNFTLFHEVGHYVLHIINNRDALKTDKKLGRLKQFEGGLEEREVNRFAASFLTDIEFLAQWIKEKKDDGKFNPAVIAKKFQVSTDVIKYQIENYMSYIRKIVYEHEQ